MKNTILTFLLVGVAVVTMINPTTATPAEGEDFESTLLDALALKFLHDSPLKTESATEGTQDRFVEGDPLFINHQSNLPLAMNRFLPQFPESIKNIHGTIIQETGDFTLSKSIIEHPSDDPGVDGKDIWIEVGGILWLEEGVLIQAAHGSAGEDQEGVGTVIAGDAGHGGNIYIQAAAIVSHDNLVRAGDGGSGGIALASGDPDATAQAGRGGDGGVVLIRTGQETTGSLWVRGGDSGPGGSAQAKGKDVDCSGEDGRDQTSWGQNQTEYNENGGDAEAFGTHGDCGPPDGRGGKGGGAYAYGGEGGTAYQGDAGDGGDATAKGGRSGAGLDACFGSYEEAEQSGISHAGHGGYASEYRALGGHGGSAIGFLAGASGNGGFAVGEGYSGSGGNATTPLSPGQGANKQPNRTAEAIGGNGGPGIWSSGPGGDGGGAAGGTFHGDHGHYCDSILHIPSPTPFFLIGILVVLICVSRFNCQDIQE